MSKIITIDDLTTYMTGKDLDAALAQQVVDAVNQYIDTYTGRCFGETKIATERKNYQGVLWLSRPDALAVTSVKYGYPHETQTTADTDDYYMSQAGRLVLSSASRPLRGGQDYVEVTYTYGSATVPDDLKLAALAIAQGFYNASENGQQDVSEVQVGSYRVKYANSSQNGSTGSTHDATSNNWAVIDSYRVRRV